MAKIAILLVYFGRLPDYFDLWLESCAFNPEFDFVVFTDDKTQWSTCPPNVKRVPMTLEGFKAHMSRSFEVKVAFDRAYKVCDFKPLYWSLLPLLERSYDFWGHCDADMVFGRLRHFIKDNILERYDKIFSVGHFTLYRNTPSVNTMFMRDCDGLDWRAVITSPNHMAFDEHLGVNRIWRQHGGDRFYENEGVVADLDPGVRRLERAMSADNPLLQCFLFDAGRVIRRSVKGMEIVSTEFMYVHFQKRHMRKRTSGVGAHLFAFCPDGFSAINHVPKSVAEVYRLNSWRLSDLFDTPYRLKRLGRSIRTSRSVQK